jgi:hypothetical protein
MAQTYANQNTDYSRDLGAEDNQVEKPGMVHDQSAPIAQDERNQNGFAKFVSASGGKVDAFATKPSPQPLTNFWSRIIQNDMGVNQEIIPKGTRIAGQLEEKRKKYQCAWWANLHRSCEPDTGYNNPPAAHSGFWHAFRRASAH